MQPRRSLQLIFPALLLGLTVGACNDRGEQARKSSQAGPATSGQSASQQANTSDHWLTTRVQSKFFTNPSLKGAPIQVQTSDRVVTLTGTVPSDNAKQEAIKVAQSIDGVSRVDDHLLVPSTQPAPAATSGQMEAANSQPPQDDGAITTQIEAKYFANPAVSSRDIAVGTSSGNVTLTGDVQSDAERQQALAEARSVPGVKGVTDQLRINPQLAPALASQMPVVAPAPAPSSIGTSGTAPMASPDTEDANLKARVESTFFESGQIRSSDVSVSTSQGVVTLTGTVSDAALKQQATQLARSTPGVKDVVDRITVRR